jgi:hypothetical protein
MNTSGPKSKREGRTSEAELFEDGKKVHPLNRLREACDKHAIGQIRLEQAVCADGDYGCTSVFIVRALDVASGSFAIDCRGDIHTRDGFISSM